MQAQFRADYAGEFVVTETQWSGGKKQQSREWIPNRIENQHISGRAACIGSDCDKHKFDFTRLQRHRGGLLGSKKLQTYGIGPLTEQMRLDFSVETNADNLDTIIANDYCKNNVVYTNAKNCLTYPEKFYLLPYDPRYLDLCVLPYLAAFDGHDQVFCLGYNKDTPVQRTNWFEEIVSIMNAYEGVEFYFVGEPTNMYDAWLECSNAQSMTYREFITYCDI